MTLNKYLYREGYYDNGNGNDNHSERANVMEVWVRKNHLGGPAEERCELYWQGEYMRCRELAMKGTG